MEEEEKEDKAEEEGKEEDGRGDRTGTNRIQNSTGID